MTVFNIIKVIAERISPKGIYSFQARGMYGYMIGVTAFFFQDVE